MDTELFWKLLEPHHPKAAAFCIRLAGNRDDGYDLYQDALLLAMRKLGSLSDRSAFRPWLFRIIVNSFKNRCRGWWWRQRVSLSPERFDLLPGDDPADRFAVRRKLSRVLAVLSPEDRALLMLHEVEGWPLAELAEVMNRPEGTVKTRLFRAKRKMRKRLMREEALNRTKGQSMSEVAYALQQSQKTAD